MSGQGPTPHAASSPAASPSPETPSIGPNSEGFSLNVGEDLVVAIADAVAARLAVSSYAGAERPEQADDDRLAVSPADAADRLGISIDHFRRHVLPDLRVVRSGRLRLVPVAELEGWLDRNSARALEGES